MAMGHHWTANTLTEHLLGELNQDRNALGGTYPTRLLNLVTESYQWLWQKQEWKFRRVRTTLSVSAETAALPADFEKFDAKWLESNNRNGPVRLTEDIETFESWRRLNTDNTGQPCIGLVEQTSLTDVSKILRVSPVPAQTYTYVLVYLRIAPDITGDSTVYWPSIMHDLWHALAKARAQRGFRRDDAWKESWAFFKSMFDDARNKNDESMRSSTPAIVDGYGDMAGFPSSGFESPTDMTIENLLPD